MAAQYVLEDIADIPVRVELASEFRYRKMPLNQKALVIVVSQSGETADTLAALRMAKEKGITTMAIVNVVGSIIAREADKVFYTLAGPEISVATTKAYKMCIRDRYISDGKSEKPVEREGILCIPCRFGGCPKIKDSGYYTAVFHAHEDVYKRQALCFKEM